MIMVYGECAHACAQRPGGRRGSQGRAEKSLSEPYRGIWSGGAIEKISSLSNQQESQHSL